MENKTINCIKCGKVLAKPSKISFDVKCRNCNIMVHYDCNSGQVTRGKFHLRTGMSGKRIY